MKKQIITYGILAVFIILFTACSTKKNTSSSRAYHNLTAHYNVLFNGQESYKKGMLTLQNGFLDDFNELLPVFIYHDKAQLSAINGDMDRCIKKATKLIASHSITVKPELKKDQQLSENERAFFNKSEYNKWVDDAYLLMGKAYFHQQQYEQASQTFQFVISNFSGDKNAYEAKIWLARIALEKNKNKEADEIIEALEKDLLFPKRLYADLHATIAYISILKSDYTKAVEYLIKANDEIHSRYYRQRYTYIIAQLYQRLNQYAEASEYYKKVIKLDPAYEMTFNARINLALTYETGKGSIKDIEKQLEKLLRDDKNIEYQDQIYYAWGNLYYKQGEKDKAIGYYMKSAAASKESTIHQARTFVTIADISYDRKNYIQAQAYYDSAVTIIDEEFPNYQIIYAKSQSLTNLVVQIQTVQLEDSVQLLAKMPQPQLYAYIDKIIESEKKADEEARERELEKIEFEAMATQQQFELQDDKGTSWYFYNSTALNLGRQDFKRKWGPRKLEDNWRRKNKSVSNIDPGEMAGEASTDETATVQGKKAQATNKYSRDYYLDNIPFTDSAMIASHDRIRHALFEEGNIYFTELKDYKNAMDAFKELLRRYPATENKLQVYYKLYSIGKITQDASLVSAYQQKIISEFPNSNYAKVLNDPEYFKKIEQEEKQVRDFYSRVYNEFDNRNYSQAAYLSKQAIAQYPEDNLVPQFEYILTVSEGVSKDTVTFISDLHKFVAKYPAHEVSQQANLLIAYLQQSNPEAAKKQEVKQAVELYKLNYEEEHYVALSLQRVKDANQMIFNLVNFNIDNYPESDLKVNNNDVGKLPVLTISSFRNSDDALKFLGTIITNQEIWRDVTQQGSQFFLISRSNFEILKKENKLEQYLLFYNQNYR